MGRAAGTIGPLRRWQEMRGVSPWGTFDGGPGCGLKGWDQKIFDLRALVWIGIRNLYDTLSSPIWGGISGIAALVGLLLPLFTFLIKRGLRQPQGIERKSTLQITSAKQHGCSRLAFHYCASLFFMTMISSVNVSLFFSIAFSKYFIEDYRDQLDLMYSSTGQWPSFVFATCFGCLISPFVILAVPYISALAWKRNGLTEGFILNATLTSLSTLLSGYLQALIYGIGWTSSVIITISTGASLVIIVGSAKLTKLAVDY